MQGFNTVDSICRTIAANPTIILCAVHHFYQHHFLSFVLRPFPVI
ncbi:hypothetical protein HMPREF1608_00818 [Escherichia coli 908525]|nr:hypothetical protein HMPREF1608_00818 [Escherichia coli 908525]ESD79178.1 hypothetical protein HMPREF1611_04564 [Escherichia coli 908573]